ncbi:uncharacterized protein N0V89_003598 [Didymosphaeria variabile]|uniref:Uncharacterized protein n=1 Tax=Didymosphaeria variabile TaxID=1932322 RepID=A0A9W8XQK5_9PLEO|nr:uncharacterized protein N0V89_003598 [Didymosphaeria variabile]KAJ4355578.1 hypothetical protein N0V89_003598 [Didymosphaeria variabile]
MVSTSFITLLLPALALAAPWGRNHTGPASTGAYSAGVAHPTGASFIPRSTGGKVTLKNNCDYDVTYDNLCPCGTSDNSGTISAGSTWTDSIADCGSGNTALKVYKDGSSKPMQFEYGLVSGNVWYDMSFIDCLSGSDDFSQCAGAGWSMGAIGSCPTYSCTGGSHCCTQGYCDPTATAATEQPNAGCGTFQGYSVSDVGVSIELCSA